MLVLLAKTEEERRAAVARWTERGLRCVAAADYDEAAALAREIDDIDAYVFFDSIGLVELLAWPVMVLDLPLRVPRRLLIYERLTAFERYALMDRYTRLCPDEEDAFTFIDKFSEDFPHSTGQSFRDQQDVVYAQRMERKLPPNVVPFGDQPQRKVPPDIELFIKRPQLKRSSAVESRPLPKPTPLKLESSTDLFRLSGLARQFRYHELLGVDAAMDREEIWRRACRLRELLDAFREGHRMTAAHKRAMQRIHVAIAEAVYLFNDESALRVER